MARPRYPKQSRPLPPPLPPETRTVGQLVGETVRLYSERFWRALALGVGPALLTIVGTEAGRSVALVVGTTGGAAILAASFAGAAAIATRREVGRRAFLVGFVCGLWVFVPLPALALIYVVPAVVWVAVFGLAVPAAVFEGHLPRRALGRGVDLLRADPVHAIFALVTFVAIVFLSQSVLFFLLRGAGDAAARVAAFLATLVTSPLLFLGGSLLYVDQAARLGSARRPKGASRADLHPALDPDTPGPADAERQS